MRQKKQQIYSLVILNSFSVNCTASGAQATQRKEVFVSPFGRDANNCGTEVLPCQTITQAVRQVTWNGEIYLNGSGTENFPYNCSRPDEHLGICIKKSLNITGFLSPHVFCPGGIYFQKKNDKKHIRVKLSGIVFTQTSLTFEDCKCVTVVNCTFGGASELLRVYMQNITTFQLDITGHSFFHNNSLCFMLLFLQNIINKSRFVTVNMSDTYFTMNGVDIEQQRAHTGGLKMVSKEKKASKIIEYVNISCNNVHYVNNFGSFLHLDVPNVLVKETYEDLNFYSNNLQPAGNNLYFSNVKETNVIFKGLRCERNPSSCCIRIQSIKAAVDIQSSLFDGIFQALYLESKINASLRIFGSVIKNNRADAGAALFATSPKGFLKINITNALFSNCRAKKYGGTISIGRRNSRHQKMQSVPDTLDFTLRNVSVKEWTGNDHKYSTIDVLLKSGKVTIEQSNFSNTRSASPNGAVLVNTLGGKSNITVLNCSVIVSGVKTPKAKSQALTFKIVASKSSAGVVSISNSLFENIGEKQKGLSVSPKYHIRVINITVVSFFYGFQVLAEYPRNIMCPIDIYIDKCTFINNIYDMLLTPYDPTFVHVTIQNSLFTSNETLFRKSYVIRLNIRLEKISSTNAVVMLDNDTFDSKPSINFAFFFKGTKNVTIKGCTFRNCIYAFSHAHKWPIEAGDFYETGSGAISILTHPDTLLKNGCLYFNTVNNTHPIWAYESYVTFKDTVFEQNMGLIAGGVHISNGFTTFKRCLFKDNFGIQQSGHIYSSSGTGRLDMEDCLFLRTRRMFNGINSSRYVKATFLYSESGGPLNLKNTSLISVFPARNDFRMFDISSGGYVHMDDKSTMQCNEGSKLVLENATHLEYTKENGESCRKNVTVIKYSCLSCPVGNYSLQKGTSRGLFVNNTIRCLRCPFGARCIERNIAAKPNFWGYQTTKGHQQQLKFSACPEHYCQSPTDVSNDFNRCRGNRNGTLCGKCAEGFTESLFSTECSEVTKCGKSWIWVVTILLTLGLVLYLLIKPPILGFLCCQILWFRRDRHQIGQNEASDSGFIKITFYFYQVAEILMDTSIENRLKIIPFLAFVISALNFQVTTVNNKIGCPFSGLTAVTKELFLSGTVFLAVANVFIVYILHLFINILRRKEKPRLIHYAAVFMEVLLLGYERLAETSLNLMHCVSIGSRKWLFIDGNIPCLQWWQYILLAYIAVFVMPFTFVLYWGSSKLSKSSITANEFLGACVLPFPFLIYWSCQTIWNRKKENVSASNQEVNRDVLEILHGPFRKGTLYWESVLIGRRFILLSFHTFITDRMLRGVCMTSACFLMTIHHVLNNPYKNPLANKSETLSLVVLTLMATINLPKAIFFSFGVEMSIDASNVTNMEMLKWIEVGALVFIPAFLTLLVTFALLSQLARFGLFVFKYIRRLCLYRLSNRMTEAYSPVIGTEES